jgi:hypothetical protein
MPARDIRNLTQGLIILLVLEGLVMLLSLWSELLQLGLIERIAAGANFTPEEADANDFRQFLVSTLAAVLNIVNAIVFLRWLFLSSRNAHEVTTGMRFTPGWTVGWYFVPIFNLWKPYQAMVELFQASHPEPDGDWRFAKRPGFLPLWWTLFLFSNALSQVVVRSMLKADTAEEMLTLSRVTVFSDMADVATIAAALVLVTRLSAFQEAKFGVRAQ